MLVCNIQCTCFIINFYTKNEELVPQPAFIDLEALERRVKGHTNSNLFFLLSHVCKQITMISANIRSKTISKQNAEEKTVFSKCGLHGFRMKSYHFPQQSCPLCYIFAVGEHFQKSNVLQQLAATRKKA